MKTDASWNRRITPEDFYVSLPTKILTSKLRLYWFFFNNNDYLIICYIFLSTFCLFCYLYVEPTTAHMHCWLFNHRFALFVFFYKPLSAEKEREREKESFSLFNHTDWELLIYSIIFLSFFVLFLLYHLQQDQKRVKSFHFYPIFRKKESDPYKKKPYWPQLLNWFWWIYGSNAFIPTCIGLFLLDPHHFHLLVFNRWQQLI